MKVLFAASECVPFVKTGGLADVVGELPQAIAAQPAPAKKIQVAVALPLYAAVDRAKFPMRALPGKMLIPMGEKFEEAGVHALDLPNRSVRVYFIENKNYFGRPGLYGVQGKDYEDNDERFIFFSKAVLELCKFADFRPDVVHCHDWQTGLVPAYLKTLCRTDAFFHSTASVFTIHNIAYQGLFPKQTLFLAGFSWHDFTPEKLEYYDQFNFLKSGLVYADKISTVSPNYSEETRHEKEGRGMDGILRARAKDYAGILNGLGKREWDPLKDAFIGAKFSLKSKDLAAKKAACKRDLQQAVRLPEQDAAPLIGMVTRLDPQKGLLHLKELVPETCRAPGGPQWVVLGSGDREIHDMLAVLARRFPRQFSFQSGFKNDLAHKIYAGSDIFFMPSEFEPCGLSQMISMRYGSIPVVTPVGGLRDTVIPFDPATGAGTGLVGSEASTPALSKALRQALALCRDRAAWQKLMRNAMAQDFSWDESARRYVDLYQAASERSSHPPRGVKPDR